MPLFAQESPHAPAEGLPKVTLGPANFRVDSQCSFEACLERGCPW